MLIQNFTQLSVCFRRFLVTFLVVSIMKSVISSDIEELSSSKSSSSQKLKTILPVMKPSESVECLSDNIVLLELEVKVSLKGFLVIKKNKEFYLNVRL